MTRAFFAAACESGEGTYEETPEEEETLLMAKRKRTGPTFIQRSRRVPASQKASYHEIEGAGKSRVKRPFFSLTTQDEDAIISTFDNGLSRLLSRT